MGSGLKKVARICGGIKVVYNGKITEYTANGKVKKKHKDVITEEETDSIYDPAADEFSIPKPKI